MSETITFTRAEPGRRRRFTLQQERALQLAAEAPGASISAIAHQHGSLPACCSNGTEPWQTEKKGLESGEEVVPVSELRQGEACIKEMEQAFGRKTMDRGFLTEAVRVARERTYLAREITKTGRRKVGPSDRGTWRGPKDCDRRSHSAWTSVSRR